MPAWGQQNFTPLQMCFHYISSCPHFSYQEMPEEGQMIFWLVLETSPSNTYFSFQMVWTACITGKITKSLTETILETYCGCPSISYWSQR